MTTFTQKEILSLLAHKKSHTHSLVQGPFASSLYMPLGISLELNTIGKYHTLAALTLLFVDMLNFSKEQRCFLKKKFQRTKFVKENKEYLGNIHELFFMKKNSTHGNFQN